MRHVWGDVRLRWGTLITSWFWLVGVIVMALLPPLIKSVLGGSEEVVTAYLAAFSIAVGIGSALAAVLAAGRIVLWPTVLGGIVLGFAALDLGWQTFGVAAGGTANVAQVFTSPTGLRALLDLVGIAIGGGLFIVPAFAAVQAWAGADRRARVVAAVNVLNAAFMVVGALAVALIQKAGAGPSILFFGLGVANLVVTLLIAATVPGGMRKLFAVADRVEQPRSVDAASASAPATVMPVMAMPDGRKAADEFPLSESSQAILAMPYPKFSEAEIARRRAAIEELMRENEADHLVFCGVNRFGSSVPWLTQWPVTTEAVGVLTPGERDALFVQHVNHAPLARELAREADVAWGGESSIAAAIAVLENRGAHADRVAVVGPLSLDQHAALSARFGTLKNLSRRYTALRQIKSAEELDWLRLAATFTDRGMGAFRDALVPGITERALGDRIERSYTADGATNWIHYIGTTPMENPTVPVPRQFPSTRALIAGDVAFAEISADFWGYTGQVLRSFTVGGEPNALYRDLHATADAAFDAIAAILRDGTTAAQVIEAAGVIEDNGFTIIDDLLHGYGGGYLPPVLGSKSRPAGPVPDAPFRAGMTVVIQPNVVTRDGKAGVQTGEMVLITQTGIERLHAFPRGFARV
jgi:Xaa-Pro aminopeptidase